MSDDLMAFCLIVVVYVIGREIMHQRKIRRIK